MVRRRHDLIGFLFSLIQTADIMAHTDLGKITGEKQFHGTLLNIQTFKIVCQLTSFCQATLKMKHEKKFFGKFIVITLWMLLSFLMPFSLRLRINT